MGYGHLNIDEREVILKMRAQQASMLQIGDLLGRSAGTISRELSRNVSSTKVECLIRNAVSDETL